MKVGIVLAGHAAGDQRDHNGIWLPSDSAAWMQPISRNQDAKTSTPASVPS